MVAHEIAHVTQRHIARAIAAAEGSQYATWAAMLAGLLIGTQNTEAGQAAVAGAAAANAQSQINFTRTNEKEADRRRHRHAREGGLRSPRHADIFRKARHRIALLQHARRNFYLLTP